jgi:hypothetical protein
MGIVWGLLMVVFCSLTRRSVLAGDYLYSRSPLRDDLVLTKRTYSGSDVAWISRLSALMSASRFFQRPARSRRGDLDRG